MIFYIRNIKFDIKYKEDIYLLYIVILKDLCSIQYYCHVKYLRYYNLDCGVKAVLKKKEECYFNKASYR